MSSKVLKVLPKNLGRRLTRVLRPQTRTCSQSFHSTPLRTAFTNSSPQRRHYATPPPQVNTRNLWNSNGYFSEWLSQSKYDELAETTMEELLDQLENLLDDIADADYEVEYSSGVLTLKLGPHGTYVINKQPPNKQIWLSSPLSGPKRYDYAKDGSNEERDDWIYRRDGRSMGDLLNEEISRVLGREVDLGIREISSLRA